MFLLILQQAIIPSNSELWLYRVLMGLLLAVCAYFLKQVADDIKETRKLVNSHTTTLSLHNIMWEDWIENMTSNPDHPNRRQSDKIVELLKAGALSKEP